MKGELRNPRKERGQITAHRQAGAKPGNHTPDYRLHDAIAAFGHALLNVVCPQRRSETAAEHADNHHSVDAGKRGAVQVNEFEVSPLFGVP